MHRTAALRPDPDPRSHRQITRTHISAYPRTSRLVSGRLEVLTLIVIAVLLILGAVVTSPRSAPTTSLTTSKVAVGDSLWTLAAAHPVDGLTTAQVAELLVRANHLDGPLVSPGQTILVPAESPAVRLAAR
jgi:hypothetical protein